MKTHIIGDVHGSYQALLRLLEEMEVDRSADRLVLLGDLMDRGPDSYEVLQAVREWKAAMGERCVYLRGNHEEMLINSPSGSLNKSFWLSNGGNQTCVSFEKHGDDALRYIDWLEKNTELYYYGKKFQCAHAGIQRGPLCLIEEGVFVWGRYSARENHYRGKLTILGHTVTKSALYMDGSGVPGGKELSYDQWRPLPRRGAILIDTGAVLGYALTGMVIDGNEFCLKKVETKEL